MQHSFRAKTRDRWSEIEVIEAFTVTFKHQCRASTVLTPAWTGSGDSYTTGNDPSFDYIVNVDALAPSTAIGRVLTTTGSQTPCDAELLTTLQMLKNGAWIDIVSEGAASPTSDKPAWLTTASVNANVATIVVDTADFTALDNNV